VTDRATAYARAVVAGEIIAGPYVRAACKRHLRDLEDGHKRGLEWRPESVARVLGFFERVLTVQKDIENEYGELENEAVPFDVEPSQAFILGSLFGWYRDGFRRFRRAYIEQGKGNGKSPLAAGIGHYMLTAQRQLRAEIYSAATSREQAMIMFRDAADMYERSPALRKRLTPSGKLPVWQLTYMDTSSFFRPVSSENKGKSGIRPYCALIDEVHEHPDDSVIEMLRAGTKGNRDALIFEITNSGFDLESVCWREHEYSCRVATGELHNDAWFSYVCALDDGDDPLNDESCWVKANPLLGVSIHHQFIREQVAEAKGMPGKENRVRRLHFCQWTEQAESWIAAGTWKACETPVKMHELAGSNCWGGMDLAVTTDLGAVAWVVEHDGKRLAFAQFFKPESGIGDAAKRDQVDYERYAKDGLLTLTPGRSIRLEFIAQYLADIAAAFDVRGVAYDAYKYREFSADCDDWGITGLPLIEHPQGFRRKPVDAKGITGRIEKIDALWMPNSLLALETAIKERKILIAENPLLRWCAANAKTREDPEGNRIFDKRKATKRIDGVVALAMAQGLAESKAIARPRPKSVYELGAL